MDTKRLYLTTFVYMLAVFIINFIAGRINGVMAEWGTEAIRFLEEGGMPPLYGKKEVAAALFSIVMEVLLQIVAFGYMSYILNVSRGRAAGMVDLTDGFSVTFKIFAAAFLQGLFITLWSMLFVVPGIVAAYRYRQTYYIMLDDPSKSALQCIRESKEMMRGHKWELFVLDLSFIGWMFLIALSAGILGIWVMPYIETTYAMYYNELAFPDRVYPGLPSEEPLASNVEDN